MSVLRRSNRARRLAALILLGASLFTPTTASAQPRTATPTGKAGAPAKPPAPAKPTPTSPPAASEKAPAGSEKTPPADEADVQFRKGNDFYRASKFAEAEAAFEAALALKKTHDIAANAGYAEIQLEKYTEAAAHLSFAVKNWPPTGKADKREFAVQALDLARQRVGALRVVVSRTGAQVLVDGKAVGSAPLEDEVFVEPGARVVEAKLEGFESAPVKVDAKAGAALDVKLELTPVKPKAPPPPVLVVDEAAVKRRKIVLIAGGASVLAGVVIGATLAGLSNSKASDADAKHDELEQAHGAAACTPSGPAEGCAALYDLRKEQVARANGAVWVFVTSGLIGAGAAIYGFSKPPTREASASMTSVGASVGPEGGVITVRGMW